MLPAILLNCQFTQQTNECTRANVLYSKDVEQAKFYNSAIQQNCVEVLIELVIAIIYMMVGQTCYLGPPYGVDPLGLEVSGQSRSRKGSDMLGIT